MYTCLFVKKAGQNLLQQLNLLNCAMQQKIASTACIGYVILLVWNDITGIVRMPSQRGTEFASSGAQHAWDAGKAQAALVLQLSDLVALVVATQG